MTPTATPLTLVSGVEAAIGCAYDGAYDAPFGRLVVAEFYGRVTQVDLGTSAYTVLGTGYTNPEDIVVAPDGRMLLTDRVGTLLRMPGAGANRGDPKVEQLATGMTAPQQIALRADGTHAYVVEYADPGTIWDVDLTVSPPVKRALTTGLRWAVGLILDPSGAKLYVGEQIDGSISEVEVATGQKAASPLISNLTAPFFLTWSDTVANRLLVPARDPANQIVAIDLPSGGSGAAQALALDHLTFRPSSVTVVPNGGRVVCSDRQIVRYDPIPTGTQSLGMGGGGSMFDPRANPLDGTDLVVSCDMEGLYRTTDDGAHWTLQDQRQVGGSARFSAAWDPQSSGHLVAARKAQGLVEWLPGTASAGWLPFQPPLPAGITGDRVTAAAFTSDARALIVGIGPGDPSGPSPAPALLRTDLTAQPWNRSWTTVTTASGPSGSVTLEDPVAIVCPDNSSICLAADLDHVLWSTDAGQSWHVLEPAVGSPGALPARTPGQPFYDPNVSGPNDPGYRASRIRGLAAAAAPGGTTVVYVTIVTDLSASSFSGGVFRCEVTPTTNPASPPAWQDVTANLPAAHNTVDSFAPWPMYERLAVAQGQPNRVWVSCIPSATFDQPGCWAVLRGTWSQGAMSWTGIYDGYAPHAAGVASNCTVQYGWIDRAEAPVAPGWGFGGPAHGLGTGRDPGAPLLFTDEGLLERADAHATPVAWQQAYTQGSSGSGWRTTGVDVTTVWHHYFHPTVSGLRFLCNTDIGLSRSADGGNTWQDTGIEYDASTPPQPVNLWGNFYELAFSGSTIYAAVSEQHDLPHDTQLSNTPGAGAVLKSVDNGATWHRVDTSVAGGGPFTAPVTSIVAQGSTLYAAVWQTGVFSSTNGGSTWTSMGLSFSAPAGPYRVLLDSQGRLLCVVAGPGGGVYRHGPSGWTELTASLRATLLGPGPNPRQGIYPMDCAVHPNLGDHLWLATNAVGGVADGGVYSTETDGQTWTKRLSTAQTGTAYGPYMHAFGAAYDPSDSSSNTLYATTLTHGVWVTHDGGGSWREFRAVPFLATQRVEFDAAHDAGGMVVATFGAGAWHATTSGAILALRARIQLEAYRLWQTQGGGFGHAVEDWLTAQRTVLHDAIAGRAYALYLARGRAPGHALDDWLRAEAELDATVAA